MAKSLIKGIKNSQWIRIIMENTYEVDIQVGKLDTLKPVPHQVAVWNGLEELVRKNDVNRGNGSGIASYYYDDKMQRHPYQVQFHIL